MISENKKTDYIVDQLMKLSAYDIDDMAGYEEKPFIQYIVKKTNCDQSTIKRILQSYWKLPQQTRLGMKKSDWVKWLSKFNITESTKNNQFHKLTKSELRNIIKEELKKLTESSTELSKFGIKELKDGLTLDELKGKFSWILDADISNAVIGKDGKNLIWYSGTWKNGTWQGGTWKKGVWVRGSWKRGVWENGSWKRGVWEGGTWKNGTWYRGFWENGTWRDGYWKGGTWNGGTGKPSTAE